MPLPLPLPHLDTSVEAAIISKEVAKSRRIGTVMQLFSTIRASHGSNHFVLSALWLALVSFTGCKLLEGNSTGEGGTGGTLSAEVGGAGTSGGAGASGGTTTPSALQETILFKMESIQGVSVNPPEPTLFTLTSAAYITRAWTYHYGATIGTKSPTVAFKDTTTGKLYGPWAQVGFKSFNSAAGASKTDPANVPGPPDNYWIGYPEQSVPAGTYQVIDSDPATWAHTADQGTRGLTWVYGWYGSGTAANAKTVTVNPSSSNQAVTLDQVTVTVPAGLLPSAATLSVAPSATAATLPPPNVASQILGAFDIGLGNSGIFDQELTLEFAYNPATLDPSVPEGENLWVSSWDATRSLWSLQPVTVDTTRHTVSVRTKHLSTWIYWKLQGYKYVAATTGYSPFEVYYHPAHAQPRTGMPASYTMTELANDVLAAMTTARQAYKDAGFTVPNYQVKVIITDAGDSNMDPYTGNLFLDRKELTTLETLRHDSGHELFHVVQNQYFNIWGMDNRRWWIEGTPDYASSVVAWAGQTAQTPLDATYFDESLTVYDNVHSYQNCQFIHYLVSRCQMNFKAMWDAVATNSVLGDSGLAALRTHVSSVTGKTFEQVWTDFVGYSLYDSSQPMQTLATTSFKVTDSATTGSRSVSVPSYAAKVVHVGVALPASGATTRHIVLSAAGLVSGATVELWQLSGTDRTTGKLKNVLVDSTSTAAFDLTATDGLQAVVINTGSAAQQVTVTANSATAPVTGGNFTMSLALDWGTNNCTKQQTVGQYRLVRNIPIVVDSTGKFSINFPTPYGYDNWQIDATGTYIGGKLSFSSGKWAGDVYSSSGSRMIANDSGTFSSNADGTITATYTNVMTAAEATYLSYPQPDTCSGLATVTASMSSG